MQLLLPLVIGAFGGFCLNMMNLHEDSKRPKSRRVRKDGLFWVFFFFWPILGAAIVFIYIQTGYKIDGLLAFTTGLSGPTILQTLMTKSVTPDREGESVEE